MGGMSHEGHGLEDGKHPLAASEFTHLLQQLLSDTFVRRRSCDRRGKMPSGLRLRNVLRAPLQGSVWESFVTERESLPSCSVPKSPLRTSMHAAALGLTHSESLLLHGTNPQDAQSILETGFDLTRTGSARAEATGRRKGSMFSTGIYLAECSSKADEYASEGIEGRNKSPKALLAMLVCRVALGRLLRVTRAVGGEGTGPRLAATLGSAGPQPYHSLMGDLEQGCGTFREFVIPRSEQVFPEFLLLYKRVLPPRSALKRARFARSVCR